MLISESAHLIWRMRCERVIAHEGDRNWCHSPRAIKTSWLRVLNTRLRQDVTASHPRFGRLAVPRNLVCDTWGSVVLLPNGQSREKWVTRVDRVLVGIDPSKATLVADGPEPHTGLNSRA